jgi:hypothetical protein
MFINRRARAAALGAVCALTAVAALGASPAIAAGSTGGVTIKTAFENSPISLNTSDAVGYQLTNTTASTQTVTFTDTLPAGVTLDNPIGTTNTSGSGSCTLTPPTAAAGSGALTLTVAVPAGTGTVCTISFSILAATPSNDAAIGDTYSGVSTASGVVPATTHGSLTVLSSPTLSFTSPTNGQSFSLGQHATASFACAATDPLDSIDSFLGTDDEGNQIQPGAPIDTVDPGTRTLEVDCYSAAGGGSVSQSVTYTVGSYALRAVRVAEKTDIVTFKALVPAGKLASQVIYGKKVIATATSSRTARGTAKVAIKPTAAGKRLLAGSRGKSVAVKLQVTFTPQAIGTGDQEIMPAGAIVVTKNIKLPLATAATVQSHIRQDSR